MNKKLGVAGYPHLALARQDDEALYARHLNELRANGFAVSDNELVPPDGMTSKDVIAALTAAFQKAKARG